MFYLRKNAQYVIAVSLLTYLGLFSHIMNVSFMTADDVGIFIQGYRLWTDAAIFQGRIAFFIHGIVAQIPYLLDSFFYFKSTQFLAIIVLLASLWNLVNVASRSAVLSYVSVALVASLWQNSLNSHNLMVSYPVYLLFFMITFVWACVFFIRYIRAEKKQYLIYSVLLWGLTLHGTEFWVPYMVFFPMIVYASSYKKILGSKRGLFQALKLSKWHILITLLNILVYALWRMNHESQYSGNALNLDVSFFEAWYTYTLGLFPGVQFWDNVKIIGLDEMLALFDFETVLTSAITLGLLLITRIKLVELELNKAQLAIAALLCFIAAAVPTFLISLTKKYQDWVLIHHVDNYAYSTFSFFGISFLILIFLVTLRKYKYLYMLAAIVIALLVLIVQLNNKYVGQKQEVYSEKFFLFDAFLKSKYAADYTEVFAPALFDYMMSKESVWNLYVKRKVQKSIHIKRYEEGERRLDYIRGKSVGDSYLLYYDKGFLKAVFSSAKACSFEAPCYLLQRGSTPVINGLDNEQPYFNGSLWLQAYKLASNNSFEKIHMLSVDGSIASEDMLGIFNYNPSEGKLKGIEFLEGVYGLETNGGVAWRWAYKDVKVNIRSNDTKHINLLLKLVSPLNRDISVTINKASYLGALVSKEANIIALNNIVLRQGDNYLEIHSSQPPAHVNQSDPRVFTFQIQKFTISSVFPVQD